MSEKSEQSSVETTRATTLTIDIREHDMIAYCVQQCIPHVTASLQVGDVVLALTKEKEEDESDAPVSTSLVFERKTIADLAASIKDGRYREQKQRLKSAYPFHRITYLIEGSLRDVMNKPTTCGMPSKSLVSALIASRYREGFQVIHTANLTETVWYLLQIRDRMGEKTTHSTATTTAETVAADYAGTLRVKTKKIDNLTPELVYTMQLSQLPGISMKIAGDIAGVYPSFSVLLKAIQEQGVKAFDAVPGMGKTRSKKVIEYIK